MFSKSISCKQFVRRLRTFRQDKLGLNWHNSTSVQSAITTFANDRHGGISALAVAGVVGIAASAAVAVDVGQVYALKNELETTADAAALAAATALPNRRHATAKALNYAAKNMPISKYGVTVSHHDVTFGHWDGSRRTLVRTDDEPTAVRVKASFTIDQDSPVQMYFASLFGINQFEVASDAVAINSSSPCIISTDHGWSDAVKLRDQSTLTVIGCGVQINSTHTDALHIADQSALEAESTCVAGDVKMTGGGFVRPAASTHCPQALDPLEGLVGPEVGACDFNNLRIDAQMNLSPGVYCGGIAVGEDGEADLAPGIYIIKDGMLRLENYSIFEGKEVMLYFHGRDSSTDFHRKAEIALTAPTTGQYEGILMFQEPNVVGEGSANRFTYWHHWLTREIKELVGTIYFPEGDIEFHGALTRPTPLNTCNVIIADEILLEAGSEIVVDITSEECQAKLPSAFQRDIALVD